MAEYSGGFDLDASPNSEGLQLRLPQDAPSKVVTALLCPGGDTGFSQSRHEFVSLQGDSQLAQAVRL